MHEYLSPCFRFPCLKSSNASAPKTKWNSTSGYRVHRYSNTSIVPSRGSFCVPTLNWTEPTSFSNRSVNHCFSSGITETLHPDVDKSSKFRQHISMRISKSARFRLLEKIYWYTDKLQNHRTEKFLPKAIFIVCIADHLALGPTQYNKK